MRLLENYFDTVAHIFHSILAFPQDSYFLSCFDQDLVQVTSVQTFLSALCAFFFNQSSSSPFLRSCTYIPNFSFQRTQFTVEQIVESTLPTTEVCLHLAVCFG